MASKTLEKKKSFLESGGQIVGQSVGQIVGQSVGQKKAPANRSQRGPLNPSQSSRLRKAYCMSDRFHQIHIVFCAV